MPGGYRAWYGHLVQVGGSPCKAHALDHRTGLKGKGTEISTQGDPVSAVREDEATEAVASIFADIRETLNVEVVNLVWRHLATMPGALEWVWGTLKPLYKGPAIVKAKLVHQNLNLLRVPEAFA